MANNKTKAAIVAVLLVGIVVVGMASASAASLPPKVPDDDDDDDEATDEEISIEMPGPSPDGAPGEGPEIVVEEVLPEGEEDEELQMSIPAAPPTSSQMPPETTSGVEDDVSVEDEPVTPAAADQGRAVMERAAQNSLKPKPTLLDTAVQKDAAASGKPVSEVINAVAKDITGSDKPTPLAQQELSEEADPHGTIALARVLISRESLPGWKTDLRGDVKEWQQGVGLDDDGKFGPVSVARMAEEAGLLPLVRYWPMKVTTPAQARALLTQKLAPVIAQLKEYLPMSEQHIAGIRASLKRETGASLGTNNPPPHKSLEWVSKTTEAMGKRAEGAGEDEISA